MARKSAGSVHAGVSLEAVHKFAFAARATEDTRPVLTCGYAQGESLATADGFRLHVAVFADESARKAVEAGENAWGLVGLDDESRKVAQDGGRFPDFKAIIPRWRGSDYVRLSVRREELLTLVKTAEVFARDNNYSVRFGWDSESRILTVSGWSNAMGDVSSAMPAAADTYYVANSAFDVAANARYMIDTLRLMQSEFITLAVGSGSKPIILDDTVQTEAGTVELFALIMPMSVDKRVSYNGPVNDPNPDLADGARVLCDPDHHTFRARGKAKTLPQSTPLIAMLNKSAKFYEDGAKTLRLVVNVEAAASAAQGEQSSVTAVPAPIPEPIVAQDNKLADVRPGRQYARKMSGCYASHNRHTWHYRPHVPSVPSLPTIEAPTSPAAEPEPVQAPEPINAPTFAESINALTFDDLCGMLADKLASAAIGRVNARLVEVGREMRTAQAYIIGTIEAAQPAPTQAPSLPTVEDLPILCDWDKGEDVRSESIKADTLGPNWSEWGEFWETPPSPDLEDTQPMPAIEPDDDPDPSPDGGGASVDYIARIEAAGRVVGRSNARIAALDQGKRYSGRAQERARLLHYSEMGHAASARYQAALGRAVQVADHDFVRACNPAYDTELARLLEAQTESALQNANHSDGVGGPADDKGGDVCEAQESIKADTLAELVIHSSEGHALSLEAGTLDRMVFDATHESAKLARIIRDQDRAARSAHTDDAALERVMQLEAERVACLHQWNRYVGPIPPDLYYVVLEFCRASEAVDSAARSVTAWHDHIADRLREDRAAKNMNKPSPLKPDVFAYDYSKMAREVSDLLPMVEIAEAARRELVALGVTDDSAVIWKPRFALEVGCYSLRDTRKAINKQFRAGLRPHKAEKLA